jgi:hypothetical protein
MDRGSDRSGNQARYCRSSHIDWRSLRIAQIKSAKGMIAREVIENQQSGRHFYHASRSECWFPGYGCNCGSG